MNDKIVDQLVSSVICFVEGAILLCLYFNNQEITSYVITAIILLMSSMVHSTTGMIMGTTGKQINSTLNDLMCWQCIIFGGMFYIIYFTFTGQGGADRQDE